MSVVDNSRVVNCVDDVQSSGKGRVVEWNRARSAIFRAASGGGSLIAPGASGAIGARRAEERWGPRRQDPPRHLKKADRAMQEHGNSPTYLGSTRRALKARTSAV